VIDRGFGATGILRKAGAGTLILSNTANGYSNGTIVQQGTLQVSGDGALGAPSGGVTIGPLGSLTYTGNSITARAFGLGGGTLGITKRKYTHPRQRHHRRRFSGRIVCHPGRTSNTLQGLTTFTSSSINQPAPTASST